MKTRTLGEELEILHSATVSYYTYDISNSVFVVSRVCEDTYYLKTDDRSKCPYCHKYTIDVREWTDSWHDTLCLDHHSQLANIEWPPCRVSMNNDICGTGIISITVRLTIPEMVRNIKTTPHGKFCLSCRVVAIDNGEQVCDECDDYLRLHTYGWWLLDVMCARQQVPRDVCEFIYWIVLFAE